MKIVVTGGAGFIGSHIVEALLAFEHVTELVVYDNFSTGSIENLRKQLHHQKLQVVEGDILDREKLGNVFKDANKVCHQAALGSVPRSVKHPFDSHQANVTGTFNVFDLARLHGVERVVYASSSSIYGDHPDLPKVESKVGKALSPYALTKQMNEQYAQLFFEQYGLTTLGLRYFNVFGPRQNPEGPYAAVIPLFVKAALSNTNPIIHGDGLQSRDFTFVANAVHANIQALFSASLLHANQVFNIACGESVTLLELWDLIKSLSHSESKVIHSEPRAGDIRHSLANIQKATTMLSYQPKFDLEEGMRHTIENFS